MHERDLSFGPVDAAAMQVAYDILHQDGGKSAGYERFPFSDARGQARLQGQARTVACGEVAHPPAVRRGASIAVCI